MAPGGIRGFRILNFGAWEGAVRRLDRGWAGGGVRKAMGWKYSKK